MKQRLNSSQNNGFTMVELVVAVTIIAIIMAILAPSMIRYVEKTRRTADVHSAVEIKNAFERVIATVDPGTSAAGFSYTSAVMWHQHSRMPTESDKNLSLVDLVFLELNEIPISQTNKNYFWVVYYDIETGLVKNIYLAPSPNSRTYYELYPDSSDFLNVY